MNDMIFYTDLGTIYHFQQTACLSARYLTGQYGTWQDQTIQAQRQGPLEPASRVVPLSHTTKDTLILGRIQKRVGEAKVRFALRLAIVVQHRDERGP